MTRRAEIGVTEWLVRWRGGDAQAIDALLPLVYDELRGLARHHLQAENASLTLQPTEVVHEVYMKLTAKDHPDWKNRAHFFAVAALVMPRILIDHARRKGTDRRGGDWVRVSVDQDGLLSPRRATELLAIDQLLGSLSAFDERKSRVVELRFFAGMTIRETAEVMGIAPMTVVREWRLARAWMVSKLKQAG